jgi:hypothetical protein
MVKWIARPPAIAAGFLAVAALMSSTASAEDITLLNQSFCVTRTETGGCGETVLPGTTIDLSRLPRDAAGVRVLYFYTDQSATTGQALIHALRFEDSDPDTKYVIDQSVRQNSPGVLTQLKKIASSTEQDGLRVFSVFSVAPHQNGRFFSSIPIPGPGPVHAEVFKLRGQHLPDATELHVTVIQTLNR